MNSLKQSLVLFIVMLIGYFSNKKGILNEEINKGLSSFLVNVSLPLLIIGSFNFSCDGQIGKNLIKAVILSFICFIITCIIGRVISKNKGDKGIILNFISMFSNVGFMGFPIIEGIYGKEGVIYASILNMVLTIFCWTYGIYLFTGQKDKKQLKNILKNPPLISTFIGIILLVFSINISDVFSDVIKMVGSTTTPLAMILIGSMMAKITIKNSIKDKDIYIGAFVRLIMIPIILLSLSKFFNLHSMVVGTIIIAEAVPPATMAPILAEIYNKEQDFASIIVFVGTVISIFTIPLLINLITKVV